MKLLLKLILPVFILFTLSQVSVISNDSDTRKHSYIAVWDKEWQGQNFLLALIMTKYRLLLRPTSTKIDKVLNVNIFSTVCRCGLISALQYLLEVLFGNFVISFITAKALLLPTALRSFLLLIPQIILLSFVCLAAAEVTWSLDIFTWSIRLVFI